MQQVFCEFRIPSLDETITITAKLDEAQIIALRKVQKSSADALTDLFTPKDRGFTLGKLSLNTERHECMWGSVNVRLTPAEFNLLFSLAKYPGHCKTREQLGQVYHGAGRNMYVDTRTIDSHVKRIRVKFKAVHPTFNAIETIYGVGYKYRAAA